MTPAEPYLVSGTRAAVSVISRQKHDALMASINDANALETRGHAVIDSASRNSLLAVGGMVLTAGVATTLGSYAVRSMDGSYEGVLRGNWCMLGFVVMLGVLNFEWGWLSVQRRRRETGQRLLRRAECQRRLATLQLGQVENTAEGDIQHETLR